MISCIHDACTSDHGPTTRTMPCACLQSTTAVHDGSNASDLQNVVAERNPTLNKQEQSWSRGSSRSLHDVCCPPRLTVPRVQPFFGPFALPRSCHSPLRRIDPCTLNTNTVALALHPPASSFIAEAWLKSPACFAFFSDLVCFASCHEVLTSSVDLGYVSGVRRPTHLLLV